MKQESSIRQNMQMLRRDWREDIKIKYPELFVNEVDDYGEEEDENGAKISLKRG